MKLVIKAVVFVLVGEGRLGAVWRVLAPVSGDLWTCTTTILHAGTLL